MVFIRSFIEAMVNNFDLLAAGLLSEKQLLWLEAELTHVRSLADMWQSTPWSHGFLCDNFWLGFDSALGKKRLADDWDFVEWLVGRELVRSVIRRSFTQAGQWVDEFPLTEWQVALIEERQLSLQTMQAEQSSGLKRL